MLGFKIIKLVCLQSLNLAWKIGKSIIKTYRISLSGLRDLNVWTVIARKSKRRHGRRRRRRNDAGNDLRLEERIKVTRLRTVDSRKRIVWIVDVWVRRRRRYRRRDVTGVWVRRRGRWWRRGVTHDGRRKRSTTGRRWRKQVGWKSKIWFKNYLFITNPWVTHGTF